MNNLKYIKEKLRERTNVFYIRNNSFISQKRFVLLNEMIIIIKCFIFTLNKKFNKSLFCL